MKVTVTKKQPNATPLAIHTEFIKLQDGEVCTMRGKKLYPGDSFSFMGGIYTICAYEAK